MALSSSNLSPSIPSIPLPVLTTYTATKSVSTLATTGSETTIFLSLVEREHLHCYCGKFADSLLLDSTDRVQMETLTITECSCTLT